ncbi:jun-like transcription factor [Elasticomyces elasticus]|nr:jun-like transcription factor [Elasticomyces elasticus]
MADPNAPIPATLWSAHSTSTPPPDLRDVLSQLGHTLSQLNYTKTLAALLKEAEKKGDAAPQAEEWGKSIEVDRAVDLLAMWEVWREKNNGKLPTLRINAAKQKRKEKEAREKEEGKSTLVPTPHAEEISSEESSSSSSESDEDEEMADKAATESESDDSSSEASSSEEDSSDDEEEVADAKVGAKRKRVLTPESESESSSSEDSSSSSSESEDEAPPAKRAKTVETEADSSSDSSSSDSDDDEDAGVAVPPTTPAAKAKAAASASSSSSSSASSSSEDSSSSESESESEAPPPPPPSSKKAKKAKKSTPAAPPPKKDSDAASAASSTTLPNSPTKPATTTLDHDELLVSVPALNALDANLNPPTDPSAPHSSTSETGGVMHPDRLRRLHPNDEPKREMGTSGTSFMRLPATEENVKKMKKGNVPFSRVPKDTVVDEKFKSNEYVSYEYADRAYQDLSVTKGKGFTKEKNKKKRGKPLSAHYMRLFGDIRDFHRILEYGPDGMDELGKDWFTIRGDGYDNWWDSDDWTTDTGDEGKKLSSALPSLSAEDREMARKARRRRRKAKARRAKERTKRLVMRKQRQLQRLRALREASVIMPREARKLGLWSAPKLPPSPEKNLPPNQKSKALKRQYTREHTHKGEPKGTVPDHELTEEEIQEKREWVQQGRYDRSLSPINIRTRRSSPSIPATILMASSPIRSISWLDAGSIL